MLYLPQKKMFSSYSMDTRSASFVSLIVVSWSHLEIKSSPNLPRAKHLHSGVGTFTLFRKRPLKEIRPLKEKKMYVYISNEEKTLSSKLRDASVIFPLEAYLHSKCKNSKFFPFSSQGEYAYIRNKRFSSLNLRGKEGQLSLYYISP